MSHVKQLAAKQTQFQKRAAEDVFVASAVGDVEWIKQAFQKLKRSQLVDNTGFNPIHHAAIHGRLECLKFFIDMAKEDVNVPSSTGWKPVHLCISNQTGQRAYTCLQYLILKGADVNATNEDNTTPLHQAATEGHVQCLKLLLEAGAKTDIRDIRNQTPLDLAKVWCHRRCARILASEQWHRDKNVQSRQIKQWKKTTMVDLLAEIEADLRKANITIERPKANLKDIEKFKDSLRNEESAKYHGFPKSYKQTVSHVHSRAPDLVADDDNFTDSAELAIDVTTKNLEELRAHHRSEWNHSTKVNQKKYIPNLGDVYPRNPLTKLPVQEDGVTRPSSSPATSVPSIIVNDKLVKQHGQKPRSVVFGCENIIDVEKKRKETRAKSRQNEVAYHLANDPNSRLLLKNADKQLSSASRHTPSSRKIDYSFLTPDVRGRIQRTIKQLYNTSDAIMPC